jgi:hypothetical protein
MRITGCHYYINRNAESDKTEFLKIVLPVGPDHKKIAKDRLFSCVVGSPDVRLKFCCRFVCFCGFQLL